MTNPTDGLTQDPNSFIDPMARVFTAPGLVYRAFFPQVSGFYRELLASPLMAGLWQQGKVVKSTEDADVALEGFDLVVRHQMISPRSYCYEWPFSMLHRAALLTLEIARKALADGVMLQDATPYNVFYQGTRPVFIDLSSLVPDAGGYLWAPYHQFCQSFLFPLYLHAAGQAGICLKLLAGSPDGVCAADLSTVLGAKNKLGHKGYLSRVALPEMAMKLMGGGRRREKMAGASGKLMKNIDTKKTRGRFLASLQKTVEAIKGPQGAGNWVDYYQETDAGVHQNKQAAVDRVLGELKPAVVVDAGSNTGAYALLAARFGAKVIALDSDPDCVERLYQQADQKGLDVLPLVNNLLHPSPALGWRNREQPALPQRVSGVMCFALALIHHLVLSGGQDFGRSLAALDDLHDGALLIEYVDMDDAMAHLLPRRPGVDYGWYSLEGFEAALNGRYRKVTMVERLSDTRVLFLAES